MKSKIPSVLTLITLFSPYYLHCGNCEQIIEKVCKTMIANVNKVYKSTLDKDSPLLYSFNLDRHHFRDPFNTNVRIEVATDGDTTLDCPVLFAIGQKHHITSLEIPYSLDRDVSAKSFIYTTAGRTLCTQFKGAVPEARNITVRVSTCSQRKVSYTMKLSMRYDFVIPMDEDFNVELTPSSPKYFGFRFSRPDVSLIRLKATSNDSNCMTLSIQPPYCPVFAEETNIQYEGLWQTMSTTSALTISKENRFADGFIVALVVHHDGEQCEKSSSYHDSTISERVKSQIVKNVKIFITNESRISSGIFFLCLFLPVLITVCIIFAVFLLFMNRHRWIRDVAAEYFSSNNLSGLLNSSDKRNTIGPASPENMQTIEEFLLQDLGNSVEIEEDPYTPDRRVRINSEALDSVDHEIKRHSIKTAGRRVNWTSSVFIAQFIQKDHLAALKSSRRFYWTVVIVAIFYSTPVYQLIIHYLRVLYRTGEYDICYYNYLCAQRLGMLIDFNHFWSNISYIIFGFAFTFLVNRRASNLKFMGRRPKRASKINAEFNTKTCCGCIPLGKCSEFCGFPKIYGKWDYGVPQHYGVFYALGLALTMEGVLSAAYHLCPNQSSFQFDTCFMYVIAVLIMLKIYQFRHPIHFGANQTFTILAGFVIVSVFGLMFEFQNTKAKVIYRWCFITCQYVAMIVTTIYYYSIGFVIEEEEEDKSICKDWTIFTKLGQLKDQPIHGDRLILPILTFSVSIAVLIYCEVQQEDFATYLLYVLVGSVLSSTLYYVAIMKPLHGEFKNRTWVQPAIYFLSAGAIGVFAVRYFVRSPAEWSLSASASREGNEECMSAWFPFHPFYDSHDIWHFFSAASLFLIFMGLLIVDDDLITTPQTRIPVF